jgi:bifunctional non-homologous end joining protein LigD
MTSKFFLGSILTGAFLLQGFSMAEQSNKLKKYRAKRNFKATPEPNGTTKESSEKALFVIQKHAASHLHYDVRLEIGGTLASWAVPKGPQSSTRIKRLAIPTEDHPIAYAHFEGVIPEGNYGAGTVMIWDIGTYTNIKKHNGKLVPIKKCLRMGTIEVFLEGKKLYGGYALIKTARGWLLIKLRDAPKTKKRSTLAKNRSALTGRTMTQIRKGAQ